MKKRTIKAKATIAALATLATASSFAANTVIEWEEPENFTDLGTSFHDNIDLENFSNELKLHIAELANRHLPDGAMLELTFTDVDLAGEHEPWRATQNVRIVRDIYPPRMSFTYQVTAASGEIIATGSKEIVDPTFNFNAAASAMQSDPFYHEKELIGSWIRNELSSVVDSE